VTGNRHSPKDETWNGRDFVVNIDAADKGTWQDCVRYSFVCAGGGHWYSRTLKHLFPGARIFAMVPTKGYVGVGTVIEEAVPIKDFMVKHNGANRSIFEIPLMSEEIKKGADNFEKREYLVRVTWIKTIPEEEAYWEKGMRANQNSAFKLKHKFTLDKLTRWFALSE
jgi:hypothetical protein